ncbi:MAG TPA: acyl carrier protein [candidate division Zixibacteria bacterium]|nr:acyl carrier protein [candidate division Zixibacteria bacterium]
MDIRAELRDFIAGNFMLGKNPEELTDDGSLLELGIIDSTGVLELVGFLEERFGMQINDEELVPDNLDSISNLIKFVQSKAS